MKTSDTLETAGFYSAIRRFSGPYMNQKESELCEKVSNAFNGNKNSSYGTNEERNAKLALNVARKFLGSSPRIVNGYQAFLEVPHSLFADYLAKDLVKGLTENDLVNNSESAIRYSREFFSSLEKQAADFVGEELIIENNDPFSKLAGYGTVKEKVSDALVTQLLKRDEMLEMGLTPTKGVILYGPPGTGKTSLAKAVCESTGINFSYFTGTDFERKWLGEGPGKIRQAVTEAKKKTPAVIFVDEAEVCISKREESVKSHTADLTATFLTHMDGMASNDLVSFLFALNNVDFVDSAVLSRIRPNYRIEVPLPSSEDRKEIFELKFSEINNEISSYEWLVPLTEGWSGRDIHNFVQAAGWHAFKAGDKHIDNKDLEAVIHDFIRESTDFEAIIGN